MPMHGPRARAKSTGHDGAIPVRRGPAVHQGHMAGLDQVVYGLNDAVHDLIMLVDRPVPVAPDPVDHHVRLVAEPAVPHGFRQGQTASISSGTPLSHGTTSRRVGISAPLAGAPQVGSEIRRKPKDPERAAQCGGCVTLRAGYRETAIGQSNSVAVWKPSTSIPPRMCAGTQSTQGGAIL